MSEGRKIWRRIVVGRRREVGGGLSDCCPEGGAWHSKAELSTDLGKAERERAAREREQREKERERAERERKERERSEREREQQRHQRTDSIPALQICLLLALCRLNPEGRGEQD